MFTCLHGKNGRGCVPEIRHGNRDNINRLVFQYLLKITNTLGVVGLRKFLQVFLANIQTTGNTSLIHVTGIGNLTVGRLHILTQVSQPATETNHAHSNFLLGILGLQNGGKGKGSGSCSANELTTGKSSFHKSFLVAGKRLRCRGRLARGKPA